MSSTELANKIRELIDTTTLKEGLSERAAMEVAVDALDSAQTGYQMRLDELDNEEFGEEIDDDYDDSEEDWEDDEE